MCSSIQICKHFLESAKIWGKNIHKTLEFFNNVFQLLRFNEKKTLKIFGTGNFQSSQFVDTLMKNVTTLLPYNICFLTLILGINICIVWQFQSEMGMGTCFISTFSLWNLNWKLIDLIYNVFIERGVKCTVWTTLSGVAARICEIEKEISGEIENYRKVTRKLKKSSNCHALCSRRFGPLFRPQALPWALRILESLLTYPLTRWVLFARLASLSKKRSRKITKGKIHSLAEEYKFRRWRAFPLFERLREVFARTCCFFFFCAPWVILDCTGIKIFKTTAKSVKTGS